MVFKDITSIMPGYHIPGSTSAQFKNIPANREVMIITFAISKDKKHALLTTKHVNTGNRKSMVLDHIQQISLAELQKQLAEAVDQSKEDSRVIKEYHIRIIKLLFFALWN